MESIGAGLGPTTTPISILPPASQNTAPASPSGALNGDGGNGGGQASSFQSEPTSTSSHDPLLPPPSATSSVVSPPTPSVITFNNTANFGSNDTGRVFYAESLAKRLTWTYDRDTASLMDIVWYGWDIKNEPFNTSRATVIATTGFHGSRPSEFVSVNQFNTTLNLTAPKVADWYEKEMVLKIEWVTQDQQKGFSQSGVFTVAQKDAFNFSAEAFGKQATLFPQDKQGTQEFTTNSSPGNPSTPPGDGGSSGGSSNGHHGGLSTGAIAGIAVACSVVGIALIAALVWFFLRRRRRHSDKGYKATRQTTSSFIAAKEARPSVAESHIVSPFSDAGEARGFSTSAIAVPLPLETTAPGTSTTALAPSTHDDSRTDRPETRNIAHLVEEGMTEADILRLEEEERHLDAEIERAARRTTD
ncbi:hypothetical protein ACHAQJ_002867 [Trichoderma viride]